MDIIKNKKSNFLYQKGDKQIKAVIDLRCFSDDQKAIISKKTKNENKKKTVFEIIKQEKTKKEYSKQLPTSQRKEEILNETIYIEKKFKTQSPNFLPRTNFFTRPKFKFSLLWQKTFAYFVLTAFLISFPIFSLLFIQKGIEEKGKILGASTRAYDNLKEAGSSISNQNFKNGINNFNSANLNFSNTKTTIEKFGMGISGSISNLPITTPLSTGKNLLEAGENISLTGKNISILLEKISNLDKEKISISSFLEFKTDINNIAFNLSQTESNLNKVELNHLPEEFKEKIRLTKEELPIISNNFKNLSEDFETIAEIFGKNKSQKYLILFQNNSEMRPTGGFIGSYGILDIENGEIKNLQIDGIFNPDGQLTEKIIPPMPIQKMSTAWSIHDANWFPDFPTSAKKIALFYEKTGGPTVDGVIALTPNVIEKMLAITGPIEMKEYATIINQDNFLTETQLQVEDLYDKEENKPKKFLIELTPKIIEKLISTDNLNLNDKIQKYLNLVNIIEESLKEKHIIFYHRNKEIEEMITERGWGGQMLNSSGNYLSVVHTNINGYKTDAVIDEQINHETEILNDGTIINTVKITRKHLGGNSTFDWYNRVNSDYLRVYVPLGSTLIEASGQTIQEYEPPINYSEFKVDLDVKKIEDTMSIDTNSGTHLFEESGKTVFGNWVYLSPQETVEIIYKYQLPYKINFDFFTKPADKYNILIQKQLGSKGSNFIGTIKLPDKWKVIWKSQGLNIKNFNENIIKTDLKTDLVYGTVFKDSSNE